LILIAAVVIGAISAYLVFNYVNSADDRAQGNARKVDVLKIAKDIPKGTTGAEAVAQGAIVTAQIPAEFKPVTAITDTAIIQDKVAVANFATGQILVDGMFADPIASNTGFSSRVPDKCAPAGLNGSASGQPVPCVAITIKVDETRGVAGVIVPGDFINILVIPTSTLCGGNPSGSGGVVGGASGTAPPDGLTICNGARYLYQQAKVLFVDQTASPQPGDTSSTAATPTNAGTVVGSSGLITLEVPPQAAQLIASVDPETLYLTLLPANYTPEALPPLNPFPPSLPGEDSAQLTPYGPQGFQTQK
jgi:Flp pilus assembly protein CpaB